jgi:hypothetical protein
VETDDPEGAIAEMMRRVGTDKMPMSDGMDSRFYVVLYEPITEKISNASK